MNTLEDSSLSIFLFIAQDRVPKGNYQAKVLIFQVLIFIQLPNYFPETLQQFIILL